MIRFRLADSELAERMPPRLAHLIVSHSGEITMRTADPTHTLRDLCGWAVDQGTELHALEVVRPSLEDVYLELTAEVPDARL